MQGSSITLMKYPFFEACHIYVLEMFFQAELNHFGLLTLLRPPKHLMKPKSTSTFPGMVNSIGSPTHTSASHADRNYSFGIDHQPVRFVHTISEAGRLLPSASQWNSIELDFHLAPQSNTTYDSLPSQYSKSFDYELVITDKKYFKRFVYVSIFVLLVILAVVLLVQFLPHKHKHHVNSKNITLALNQALTFFDAQKCNIWFFFFSD